MQESKKQLEQEGMEVVSIARLSSQLSQQEMDTSLVDLSFYQAWIKYFAFSI